jgi:hypothetical protein
MHESVFINPDAQGPSERAPTCGGGCHPGWGIDLDELDTMRKKIPCPCRAYIDHPDLMTQPAEIVRDLADMVGHWPHVHRTDRSASRYFQYSHR